MPVHHSATHPADPDRVFAVLTEEQFLRDYAAALGATVQDARVDRAGDTVTTTLRMDAPTRGVPAVFERFVGRSVTVTDRRVWRPSADGGYRADLAVGTRLMSREAVVRGDVVLAAAGASTVVTVTGAASVDAPIIGRQAEAAVTELAGIVLRQESELLQRRLTTAS